MPLVDETLYLAARLVVMRTGRKTAVRGVLAELGVEEMVLLTNTHHTLVGLDGYGLSIVGERPIDLKAD